MSYCSFFIAFDYSLYYNQLISYYFCLIILFMGRKFFVMNYESIELKSEFCINRIISIHYFEYMSDFYFQGEAHNFWEFLCVDKGEVEVQAGKKVHLLKKGDIIFHRPMEFHNVKANGVIAPNLVVISFECPSPAMTFFEHKILQYGETEKRLLSSIIEEARQCFSSRLDDPSLLKLERQKERPFGGEQLIGLYLQELLIRLIRREQKPIREPKPVLSKKLNQDQLIFERVCNYFENNISRQLKIDEICKAHLVGRSHIQKIFRDKAGCGVIEYFSRMKVETAKQMIRNSQYNFTEIADKLRYSSIHYFSKQFKKISGMSPSEYSLSIQDLSAQALSHKIKPDV